MKRTSVLLVGLLLVIIAAAADKTLINLDRNRTGIKGYDPVALFTEKRPVKGTAEFTSEYNGARYQFASAANKAAFEQEPAKYEPQFGGYCAYAVSRGYTADIDPAAFMIVNDRLLMQYSVKARDKFNEDPQGNLKRADQNWPGIVAKEGK